MSLKSPTDNFKEEVSKINLAYNDSLIIFSHCQFPKFCLMTRFMTLVGPCRSTLYFKPVANATMMKLATIEVQKSW